MSIKRTSEAKWNDSVTEGSGEVKLGSGAFAGPYSFNSRFGDDTKATNPEELIAAAHAGCFSMALSGQLTNAGFTPASINTTAAVRLEKLESGFAVTKIHLDVTASVPEATDEDFQTCAANAKAGCPISKLLNAEITMDARLES